MQYSGILNDQNTVFSSFISANKDFFSADLTYFVQTHSKIFRLLKYLEIWNNCLQARVRFHWSSSHLACIYVLKVNCIKYDLFVALLWAALVKRCSGSIGRFCVRMVGHLRDTTFTIRCQLISVLELCSLSLWALSALWESTCLKAVNFDTLGLLCLNV